MSPAPHPRMHGLTHVPGGPDPIPGLIRGIDMEDPIMSLLPDCYWKLDETTGDIAHDSSGNNHHLTADAGYDPPVWGEPAGPPGTTSALWVDNTNRVSTTPGDTIPDFTDDFTAGVWVNVAFMSAPVGEIMGQGVAGFHSGSGWSLTIHGVGAGGHDPQFAVGVANDFIVDANTILEFDSWYFLAVVRDEGTWKLYLDGLLQTETATTSPGTSYGANTWLGNDGFPSHSTYSRDTRLSHAFILNRALASTDFLQIMEAFESGTAGAEGWVPALDEDGNPVWQPPGVEVEHGGGDPAESPVTSPPPSLHDGPTSAGGWYYTMHRETLVLYDSTPARFDVPSRQWTRVPFSTARIQRTWELVPGGQFREAWLPDDRGVTAAAKNGVLQVTADMLFDFGADVPAYPDSDEQYMGGWFAIEYPVLEDEALPESLPPDPDGYVRAARMVNTRTGQVVRDGADRAFYQWFFSVEGAAGGAESVGYPADNPYPIYPHWAARPMTRPLPYPQMSPTDSLTYYQDTVGNPSFGGLVNDLKVILTGLVAGDTFVLQAWQDTPWPLRFSTDHFPNFRGFHDARPWINQPWLKLEYYYDPETIDHTTGRLL